MSELKQTVCATYKVTKSSGFGKVTIAGAVYVYYPDVLVAWTADVDGNGNGGNGLRHDGGHGYVFRNGFHGRGNGPIGVLNHVLYPIGNDGPIVGKVGESDG